MSDDEKDDSKLDTVPPPLGEDDAYNAPTRVGPMDPALLEAMMAASRKPADVPPAAAATPATSPTSEKSVPVEALSESDLDDAPPSLRGPPSLTKPPPVPQRPAPAPVPIPLIQEKADTPDAANVPPPVVVVEPSASSPVPLATAEPMLPSNAPSSMPVGLLFGVGLVIFAIGLVLYFWAS